MEGVRKCNNDVIRANNGESQECNKYIKKIMHWKKLCSTHYPSCSTVTLNLGRTISLKMQAAECGSRDVL